MVHANNFVVQRCESRIVFAAGCAAQIGQEAERIGASRILVVCSPGRVAMASTVANRLGQRIVGTLPIAAAHVPLDVVQRALAECERTRADALLAFGGGSALGLGKAIAAERPLKLLAVPTTYSGSEMTDIYGVTAGGHKRTSRSDQSRPALVLYDAELTLDLPLSASIASLWNAMAHCVQTLWWPQADPVALLAAEHGLRTIAEVMPLLCTEPTQLGTRERAMVGAYLAGVALSETGMGLQHELAHLLGGSYGLSHAATHAALLPHVVRYNAEAAPIAASIIARALSAKNAADALRTLALRVGAPTSLAALGFSPAQIDTAIDKLLTLPILNPRPLQRAPLQALLTAAHYGKGYS